MKNFACPQCGNKVYFENVTCLRCRYALGFDAAILAMDAIVPIPHADGHFHRVGRTGSGPMRYCANVAHGVCNWLIPANDPNAFCSACSLNRMIPNLSEPGSLDAWSALERAKKRLVYSLIRFGLPLTAGPGGANRLSFEFLRNSMTGHFDGVVTINVIEADAVERERQRQHFDESYRSILGHLRHESGHFYWMVLVEDLGRLDDFRAMFGDEREDYGAALARHHANGPPLDWSSRHVSAYASSHPWEDWAETWAHYLHLVDALDTADAEGMEPRTAGFALGAVWPFTSVDLYRVEHFDALLERWIPLAIAMNSLNRSMGHSDFYPFVIPAPASEKLRFIHDLVRAARERHTVEGATTTPPANSAPASHPRRTDKPPRT